MIILGTNSIKETGFDVANSVRFNPGDSAYMHKTPSAGNRQKATFSCWVKRSLIGSAQTLFWAGSDNSNYQTFPRFLASDKLVVGEVNSGSTTWEIVTDRVFRDVSAWYHIVIAMDTTQGTAANRIKIYVNGVQETSLDISGGYPAQNRNTLINTGVPHQIGHDYVAQYYGGYVAEACFLEAAQSAPTDFGEFDSDSGIWKPIDVSGLTFGTNGFYLDFEDSANLGNDANGGTDLTEVNLAATDQSTDTCTNNMPVFNSNDNQRQGFTFTEGNLKITATPSYDYVVATMGVSSGKWYWETKIITIPNLDYIYNGISDHNQYQADWDMGGEAGQYCLSRVAGKIKAASTSETTYGGSMVANDIQGFALDVDNLKLYISNNGQWSNGSGAWDSTTFNASTGVINIAYSTLAGGGTHWFPAIGNGSGNIGMEINFGSPVSAISSGNADGNGYGNMEFPIPSGYFCLNTKNLAEYG